jgi:uncharacterized protein YecE (DUF72 family)
MRCYIGCSGFHNKDWKGSFYPEKLSQSKWFEYYCSRFNTLELNTTFYRFPRVEFLERWYKKSPEDFVFSVKVPRLITHYKQLNDTARMLNDFYTAVRDGLKEKLGPVLFQLPSRIVYSEDFLQRIIQSVDVSFINVVEFRHVSWWNENVSAQLAKHNIIFCGISHPHLPDEVVANTSTLYYRFHGVKKLYFSQYPKKRIIEFAGELFKKANDKKVYVYFNNTATIAAVNNGMQLEGLLSNKKTL